MIVARMEIRKERVIEYHDNGEFVVPGHEELSEKINKQIDKRDRGPEDNYTGERGMIKLQSMYGGEQIIVFEKSYPETIY